MKKISLFAPYKDNELQRDIDVIKGQLISTYHWNLIILLGRLEQTVIQNSKCDQLNEEEK